MYPFQSVRSMAEPRRVLAAPQSADFSSVLLFNFWPQDKCPQDHITAYGFGSDIADARRGVIGSGSELRRTLRRAAVAGFRSPDWLFRDIIGVEAAPARDAASFLPAAGWRGSRR